MTTKQTFNELKQAKNITEKKGWGGKLVETTKFINPISKYVSSVRRISTPFIRYLMLL